MGIRETPRGTFTAVRANTGMNSICWQILADHKLLCGFLDASHESVETVNGTRTASRGKRDYRKEDGLHVHLPSATRLLEVDKSGRVADAWI